MPTYERHVLFVDDDSDMQGFIRNLMEPRGVKVTTASDGQEALRQMHAGLRPDVIISDIEMPHMDGFAFLRAVRAVPEWAPVPFIVLSAHDEKPSVRQALMLGVDDYIVKPFDEERLLLTIYSKAKRTQELTRYAEAAYETLAYVRRDMARMFTHELRTPLVSLNMVAEILSRHSDDLTPQDVEDLITTLQTGLTRLNRLMEQMVLLIQLDTGELQKLIQEAARPGPLWDAVTAAVSQARNFNPRQRDVEVTYQHGEISGEIVAEWKSLRHAMAELIANAMAFSPKEEPVVVSQRIEDGHIVISIMDKGPGIPEAKQHTLFRRFQQVEREKHDQQGIGMGLYLSRSIIEATGGTLDLKSEPNKGTQVTIKFPLVNVQ
jgi:two-component system sensor histidine kinase/response regulator